MWFIGGILSLCGVVLWLIPGVRGLLGLIGVVFLVRSCLAKRKQKQALKKFVEEEALRESAKEKALKRSLVVDLIEEDEEEEKIDIRREIKEGIVEALEERDRRRCAGPDKLIMVLFCIAIMVGGFYLGRYLADGSLVGGIAGILLPGMYFLQFYLDKDVEVHENCCVYDPYG